MERLIAGAVLAAGLLLSAPGMATAGGPCEHRTQAHLDEHGGRHTDDAYHVARGELPSCDYGSDKPGSSHDQDNNDESRGNHWPGHDKHRWWRND